MFPYHVIVGIILAGILALTGQASAGWVIDEVVKGVSEGGKQQVVLQSNQMKTVTAGADGKPTMAFIMDLNAETITQVDYKGRYYATTKIQEYVQTMQGVMAGAMKQMEETMKDMPPEQRKMMEEMMRSQMGQGGKDCRGPKIEVRKTGQQTTIADYSAVRYDILADGKMDSELWIARGITAWKELDPKKLERFAAEMEKLAGCGSQGRQGTFGSDPSWKVVSEGYPVRTVNRSGRVTIEVVKAESRTVPASEFQPPSGFARKTFREMMGQ